ncbi:uncharacterized protein LOC133180806 [Saccostrea echinata]|uniref:uncharacterized protein LOC133180806 n=1 Tax=Saccostrea echinata TaxID=191078 RepID=UPI002A805701|nr:uncharacterized protein LOC133180806 [Saccostrea echinata]
MVHCCLMILLIFGIQEYGVDAWEIKIVRNDTTLISEVPRTDFSTPINSSEVTLINSGLNSTHSDTLKNTSNLFQGKKEKNGTDDGVIIIFVVFSVLVIFLATVVIIRIKKKMSILPTYSSLQNLCCKETPVPQREFEMTPMNTTGISDV